MAEREGIWNVVGGLTRLPRTIARSWNSAEERGGGFLTATLIGWAIEFLYGVTVQGLVGGIRVFCLLWFASGGAFFVGTIVGFLFGVPKAKVFQNDFMVNNHLTEKNIRTADAALTSSVPSDARNPGQTLAADQLYRDNSNLEEVSDWLTKIIIGIGLAQFSQIVSILEDVGDKVGLAIDPTAQYGGKVIAVGSIIVGFATGFLHYYVWARMILLRNFLKARALADGTADAARQEEQAP